jgi:hypothetical protein
MHVPGNGLFVDFLGVFSTITLGAGSALRTLRRLDVACHHTESEGRDAVVPG